MKTFSQSVSWWTVVVATAFGVGCGKPSAPLEPERETVERPAPAPTAPPPGSSQPTDAKSCASPECAGSLPPSVVKKLTERASLTQDCYERALRSNRELQGRVLLGIRMSPSGTLCHIRVEQSELGSQPELEQCLITALNVTYPPPQGGCVDLQLPLRFVPKEVENVADAGAPEAGGSL